MSASACRQAIKSFTTRRLVSTTAQVEPSVVMSAILKLQEPYGAPTKQATRQRTAQQPQPQQQHYQDSHGTTPEPTATAAATALKLPPRRSVPTAPTPVSAMAAKPLSDSVRHLLPMLRAQAGGHYITVHIHGFPYLVTVGDELRLPVRIPGLRPGDVLRLDCASVLGSRSYTLRGAPLINQAFFVCRATVIGIEAEPMRFIVKKQPRCRRKKTVRSKLRFTVLRISELKINSLEEIEARLNQAQGATAGEAKGL